MMRKTVKSPKLCHAHMFPMTFGAVHAKQDLSRAHTPTAYHRLESQIGFLDLQFC